MARFFGTLLVGLALGAIGGSLITSLFFGAGASPVNQDGAVATSSAARAAPARTSADAEAAAPSILPLDADRKEAEDSRPSSAPISMLDAAVDLARRAPEATKFRGPKSIRGVVVDLDGRPVAGVVVRTGREPERRSDISSSRIGEGALPRKTLERAVREAVDSFYEEESDLRDATTDADGRFAFTELREGRWWVVAWREGYDVNPRDVDPRRGEISVRPDAICNFTAAPVAIVPIAVLMADGSAAVRAAVEIRHPGEKRFDRVEPWSAGHRYVGLAAGEWQLRATLGDSDHGPSWKEYLSSSPQTIDVAVSTTVSPLTFRLKGTPGIRGEVHFAGSGGDRSVSVKLLAIAPGVAPDLTLLANQTDDMDRGDSFFFKDLQPGRYVIGASRRWLGRIIAHAVVDVGQEVVEQDLVVPEVDLAKCVVVIVKDSQGRPVQDVEFEHRVKRNNSTSSGGIDGERQSDGSYLFPIEDLTDFAADRPGGTDASDGGTAWPEGMRVSLTVKSERFGDKEVAITPSTRRIDIAYGVPATLIATAQGYAGSGCEGRLGLSLVPRTGDSELGHRRRHRGGDDSSVGPDGTLRIGPVDPGDYLLQMFIGALGGNPWEQTLIATQPLSLGPGENRASIPIPALCSLTVEVAAAAEDVSLTRAEDDALGFSLRRSLDADHRARFDDLVAGDYVLSTNGGDPGSMRVRLPISGIVRFKPVPLDALEVWIHDDAGRLAKAGFQNEDVIIAVDGKEFSSAAEMQKTIASLLSEKQIKFTVRRDSRKIELAVDGTAFSNPFDLGGSLVPASR